MQIEKNWINFEICLPIASNCEFSFENATAVTGTVYLKHRSGFTGFCFRKSQTKWIQNEYALCMQNIRNENKPYMALTMAMQPWLLLWTLVKSSSTKQWFVTTSFSVFDFSCTQWVLPRSADCRLLMSVWLRTLMHVQLCNAYSSMWNCGCILNVSELFSLRILYLFKWLSHLLKILWHSKR